MTEKQWDQIKEAFNQLRDGNTVCVNSLNKRLDALLGAIDQNNRTQREIAARLKDLVTIVGRERTK